MDAFGSLVPLALHPSSRAWQVRRGAARTSFDRQRERSSRFWGDHTGPNPTDRAKAGCKRHFLTDAQGIPLAVTTSPANHRDDRYAMPLLFAMPSIPGRKGRPRKKPIALQGDAGYGSKALRSLVRLFGVHSMLAPLGGTNKHSSGLGKTRYPVERTLSWFGNFRRIKFCYERNGRHFQAFHELAASILCANRLSKIKTPF